MGRLCRRRASAPAPAPGALPAQLSPPAFTPLLCPAGRELRTTNTSISQLCSLFLSTIILILAATAWCERVGRRVVNVG